jgi:hypothetical protein
MTWAGKQVVQADHMVQFVMKLFRLSINICTLCGPMLPTPFISPKQFAEHFTLQAE